MFTKSTFLFCNSVIFMTSACVSSQANMVASADALQRYRASLSYVPSISMHIVANIHSTDSAYSNETLDFVFRRDGDNDRAEWVGKRLLYGKDAELDSSRSSFIKDIADGHMYVGLEGARLAEGSASNRRIVLQYKYQERVKDLLENPNNGGPLLGNMYGSAHKSVADLLTESADLHVHDEHETIGGIDCLVFEGTSKNGKVTAWIAPDKGYSAMKWVIGKSSSHLFDGTEIATRWPDMKSGLFSFEVKEFREIAGAEGSMTYVPTLATFTHTTSMRDGSESVDQYEYKVSDIQVKPDFGALGAFKIEFPEGTRVFNKDIPGIRFHWKDGRPAAIVDGGFLVDMDKEIGRLKGEVEAQPVQPAGKQVTAIPTRLPGEVEAQPVEPKGKQTTAIPTGSLGVVSPPQTPAASAFRSVPIWACASAVLVIIGLVGWLVFRRSKA